MSSKFIKIVYIAFILEFFFNTFFSPKSYAQIQAKVIADKNKITSFFWNK
jgi:hypothetical protein